MSIKYTLNTYDDRYQPRYGFLRSIIPEVVHKFMDCGDLERGFARVRCDHCQHEYLLAFSYKGRWLCLPRTVPARLWREAHPATCLRRSGFGRQARRKRRCLAHC
ncbi:transposase zinc-binding domain-containing protein [Patescibacteria group bacterium]|nr:transposase zinc-binding domain-containing protein [Patescibacteria group bacterium]